MKLRFVVAAVLFSFAALSAFAGACNVCDGLGCRDAKRDEFGRTKCVATSSACTISGSQCYSDGSGCSCGDYGCGFCENSCNESLTVPVEWELAAIEIIPAPRTREAEWVLVDVSVSR